MAQITYNGVCLPYPMFTNFEQIAKRDDQGDTDPIGIQYRISVQCLITAAYIPLLVPDFVLGGGFATTATTSPADIMGVVRNRLSQPRKQLSVQFNGVELIPYRQNNLGSNLIGPQSPDNIDAMNGPKPEPARILQLNNNSFLLIWAVQAHFVENLRLNPFGGAGIDLRINQPGSPILYNRWSEELGINSLNLCRRVRRGKFMVRSDNLAQQIADQFTDQFAILGVPPGWTRESSDYTVDPSGLAISYTVVDKQHYKMPPEPAYESDGYFTESTSTEGAKVYGDCKVVLRGSGVSPARGADILALNNRDPQSTLANLAVAVALHKIQVCLAGVETAQQLKIPANKLIMQNASLTLSLWKCEVEFNCRFLAAREKKMANFLPFSHISTGVYQQEKVYTPKYPVHGSAGFLIQAAAYYDPALQANPNWNGATGQWQAGVEPGKGYGGKT